MGRLLSPTLEIDIAASVAAASIGLLGCSRTHSPPSDESLEELTAKSVMSGKQSSLIGLRKLISEYLESATESGAANMSTAPVMLTISAEPPSNH